MGLSLNLRAVMLSLFGAVLGSLLWALTAISADLERALPALLVGIFAGAFPLLAPDRGPAVRIFAIVFTLLGLVVTQYFVVRHSVVTELVESGADRSIPMFLSPGSTAFVTFGWLRVYPVDALLWVVAAAFAAAVPRPTVPTHLERLV